MTGGVSGNASGRPNRVAPDGSTHRVPDRGLFWGNRGRLLNARGDVARHCSGRNWIVCVLEFHGRHRTQWRPDRLTELYFLDEATAFAAGHRPCGECRYAAYRRFRAAWGRAHPDDPVGAAHIDRRLHADRLDAAGHRTHDDTLATLPAGTIVEHDHGWWLVHGDALHPWRFGGYGTPRARTAFPAVLTVRTPRATVAAMRAGYAPVCAPTS